MISRFSRPTRVALALGAATLLTVSLAGCSVIGSLFPAQAERDVDTAEVSAAGEADAFSLVVGDCFNDDMGGDTVESVPAVPCSEPHDNEVYYLFDVTDATYPGEEGILQAADEGCIAEFPNFVGMAYADSAVDFSYLYPSEGSWKDGDREIVCIAYEAQPTIGSLSGAGI